MGDVLGKWRLKAVILAGGLGKRLKPLTDDLPKPMVEVLGRPILIWQLKWLGQHGIDKITLCMGYMKDSIINYVGSGSRFGVEVEYAVEEHPLGTGGALRNAESLLSDEGSILVLNGDVLTDLDPVTLTKAVEGDTIGAVAVVPLRSPFGIVDLSENGKITGFREKPLLQDYWINAGAYCLTPEIFRYLPEKGNIENTAFPQLAKENRLKAVQYPKALWKSIDNHKDIEDAEREFADFGKSLD